MASLNIRNVKKAFGPLEVLKGINLELNDGEFLVLLGTFSVSKTIDIAATLGLVTGAVYALIAMQRVFQGEKIRTGGLIDFGARELTAMIPMMIGLTWLGVYPQPVFDLVEPALASLYEVTTNDITTWIGSQP